MHTHRYFNHWHLLKPDDELSEDQALATGRYLRCLFRAARPERLERVGPGGGELGEDRLRLGGEHAAQLCPPPRSKHRGFGPEGVII